MSRRNGADGANGAPRPSPEPPVTLEQIEIAARVGLRTLEMIQEDAEDGGGSDSTGLAIKLARAIRSVVRFAGGSVPEAGLRGPPGPEAPAALSKALDEALRDPRPRPGELLEHDMALLAMCCLTHAGDIAGDGPVGVGEETLEDGGPNPYAGLPGGATEGSVRALLRAGQAIWKEVAVPGPSPDGTAARIAAIDPGLPWPELRRQLVQQDEAAERRILGTKGRGGPRAKR